jgi:UDP-N-acetylmuramoyl-L-alanyl-D-glutamate--2,6-diaminopimelate ligase
MRLSVLLRELERITGLVTALSDPRDRTGDEKGSRPLFLEAELGGVTADSRQVRPGMLFVAVPGGKTDGHRFVEDAVGRGAVAILVEHLAGTAAGVPQILVSDARLALAHAAAAFYANPSKRLLAIGITGTKGKSTTAFLVRSILEAAGRRVGLLGTIVYDLGRRTVPAPLTTPDSVALQGYLAEMVEAGLDSVVMEVSSHALAQRRAAGIDFRVGVFTHLSPTDHTDYHTTPEDYIRAKGLLFRGLAPGATAVLNYDDPVSFGYAASTRANVLWYGSRGDVRATTAPERMTLAGSDFVLSAPGRSIRVRTRLIGRHNVENCVAAAAAGLAAGVDLETIVAGIERLQGVPGRLERLEAGQPFEVLIDYAHTDDALMKVLRSLRPLVAGRLIVVFGAGGDRDTAKRPRMGRVAAEWADRVWLTSDNPRNEDPSAILEAIAAGVPREARTKVRKEIDRRRAIVGAIAEAGPHDLVLLAGKGHERTQKLRDVEVPFDDADVAREAITGQTGWSQAV